MQRTRYSIVGLLVAAALVTPLVSFAQTGIYSAEIQARIDAYMARIAELQAQLQRLRSTQAASTTPSLPRVGVRHNICYIVRTLAEGEENSDIRTLQEYLREQGLLNASATGYFGLLTRDALRRWQANNGIVSEGDAATTGWGRFGPRTRAFIARWCAGNIAPGGFVPIGATSTTAGNLPPTISNFTGPTTLTVGQTGTWTVTASDPEGGTLSYHITWGEIATALNSLLQLAGLDNSGFVATSTFTHSYSAAGLYPVAVRVKDTAGGIAAASRFVRVNSSSSDGFGEGNICTADTYQCPSGHWVGRTGANCQFVCPNNTETDTGTGWTGNSGAGIEGCRERGDCPRCMVVADTGQCLESEHAAPGGGCWFNQQIIANGSWIAAFEEQFVAGSSSNKPCKLEVRVCQSGTLTGTYRYPTCSASDLQSGG